MSLDNLIDYLIDYKNAFGDDLIITKICVSPVFIIEMMNTQYTVTVSIVRDRTETTQNEI